MTKSDDTTDITIDDNPLDTIKKPKKLFSDIRIISGVVSGVLLSPIVNALWGRVIQNEFGKDGLTAATGIIGAAITPKELPDVKRGGYGIIVGAGVSLAKKGIDYAMSMWKKKSIAVNDSGAQSAEIPATYMVNDDSNAAGIGF